MSSQWNELSFPNLNITLDVNPDAFTIGSFVIKWYAICITIGAILAVVFCFRKMKTSGLDEDRVIDVVFWGFLGGIVGARTYYVLFNLDSFKDFKDIINIRNGGLAIFGGIIGAILVGFIVSLIRKVRFLPLLDLGVMGFSIGQACGRWGNFFNHEAFGCNTNLPWGMTSPRIQSYLFYHQDEILQSTGVTVDPSLPVHPCFLYESIWCLIGFIILALFYKKRRFDGEMTLIYLCWYGFERMFVEGLRTDSLMVGNFRVSQVLSAVIFAVSLIMLIVINIKIKKGMKCVLYVDTEESKLLLKQAEEKIREANEYKKSRKSKAELTDEQKILDEEEIIENDIQEENENGNVD